MTGKCVPQAALLDGDAVKSAESVLDGATSDERVCYVDPECLCLGSHPDWKVPVHHKLLHKSACVRMLLDEGDHWVFMRARCGASL